MSGSPFTRARAETTGGSAVTTWWLPGVPLFFLLLHRLGLTGRASVLYIVVVTGPIALGPLLRLLPRVRESMDRPPTERMLRAMPALMTVIFLLVDYGMGWGPVLVSHFALVPIIMAEHEGAPRWRVATAWAVGGVVLGQVGIQLGWVYSYIGTPEAHGLAAVGILCVLFVAKSVGTATEERRRAEHQLDALIQNGSDMITVVDRDAVVVFQAASSRAVLGRDGDELLGSRITELVHPEDIAATLAAVGSGVDRVELRMSHQDGSWRWCEGRVADLLEDPLVQGFVLNIRDISDRKALEEELRFQAFHDSLTGLANRALFADRMDHALARHARNASTLALVLIDLDDFKQVNDSLGHGAGDDLLNEVATRLRSCTRSSDTVARLGGDEFAVLLEDISDEDELTLVGDRILAALTEEANVGDRLLPLSASVGIAVAERWTTSRIELVRNADVAMYAAKSKGKGCVVRFEADMHLAIHQRLALRLDLAQAVGSGDQMELYYQPVIDLASGAPVGVEALIRWHHPVHGLIPPMDFIPLAEETGLILPLGRWVLRDACRQAAAWNTDAERPMAMSVNVSARQIEDDNLVGDVRAALLQTGLDPSVLTLEITESVLMAEPSHAAQVLRALKALGVRLAIDDFGTGYSSLGYLHDFPIDILKVDRCFINGLSGNSDQATLAEAVVTIGRTLHLETVAEGVERTDQADTLRGLGCELGQGFLFSEPLPADALTDWLAHARPVPKRSVAAHNAAPVPLDA